MTALVGLALDESLQDGAQYTFTFSPATSSVLSGQLNLLGGLAALPEVRAAYISAKRPADFIIKFTAEVDITFVYSNANADDDTVGELANKMITQWGSSWFGHTDFVSAVGGPQGTAFQEPDTANQIIPGVDFTGSDITDAIKNSGWILWGVVALVALYLFFQAGGARAVKGALG
jgi:hypothetical protein